MTNIKTEKDSRDSRRRKRVNSQNDYASSNGDGASRGDSCNHNGVDSDSSSSDMLNEGRTRRPRKPVVYKEKPLNRYLSSYFYIILLYTIYIFILCNGAASVVWR